MCNKLKCVYCQKSFPDTTEYFYPDKGKTNKLCSYCRKCHGILSKKYAHIGFGLRKKINKNLYSDHVNTAINQIATKGLRSYGESDPPKSVSVYQYLSEAEEKKMKQENLDGNWRFNFGKHSGTTLFYVAMQDYSYIEWCLHNVSQFKAKYEKNKEEWDKVFDKARANYIKYLKVRIPKSGHFYKEKVKK